MRCWPIFVVWLFCGISSLSHSHRLAVQLTGVHAVEAVSEQMSFQIGGIPQWITIKGKDRNNAVVLILHGGPGDALTQYADSLYTGMGQMVHTWCNGTSVALAETFTKNGPSIEPTMTVERVAQVASGCRIPDQAS